MDLKAARIVLRPRAAGELFDLAFRYLFAADPRLYLRLTLALCLPAWALCTALAFVVGLPWVWVWATALLLSQLISGPFCIAAGRLMFEPRLRLRDVTRQLRGRLFPYLGASILRLLAIVVGLSLLVFPGLVATHRLLYASEAVLLEQAPAIEGLRRSSRFARGYGSNAVGMAFGLPTVALAFVVTFETLGQGIVSFLLQLGEPLGTLWSQGGSPFALLGLFLAVPYLATARFLAYIDQRTRQDGWDVQVKFMAVLAADGDRRAR